MHALLFTLLTLGAGPDAADDYYPTAEAAHATVSHHQHAGCDSCGGGGCDTCGGSGLLSHKLDKHLRKVQRGGWFGPMPQTCYDPRYGCYNGSRAMNRYPAFHGTYYRNPYNYRNVFDYPWHAELHEPTSHFSYNVPGERNLEDLPPLPPTSARSLQTNVIRPQSAADRSTGRIGSTVPRPASIEGARGNTNFRR